MADAIKEAKANAVLQGRKNIVAYLTSLITNLEVSVESDYEKKKEGVPASYKAAHLPYYKKLAEFKKMSSDQDQLAIDEIAKLKEQINGGTNPPDASPASNRSANISKPAAGK